MNKTLRLLVLLMLGFSTQLFAAQATLLDGRVVELGAPGSQVFVVGADGRRAPLWDGVHQLQNGARLTIRGGVLTSSPWLTDGGALRDDSCDVLIERVCGRDGQCSDSTACGLAKQLQAMEDEAAAARQPGMPAPQGSGQCNDALRDVGFFKPCRR